MKKILVLFAVLLLAASGVLFAAEGRIGVSIAPEWFWNTEAEDSGSTDFVLLAEGANYFGRHGGFGIEYGLGVSFPVNTWVAGGEPTKIEDGKNSFVFKAGAGYKHAFGDVFGLSAGLGVRGTVSSLKAGDSVEGVVSFSGKTTKFIIDLYGSVAADITLLDFLGIRAGVMVGGPVVSTAKTTVEGSIGDIGGSHTETVDLNRKGIWLSPFVGVSFVY